MNKTKKLLLASILIGSLLVSGVTYAASQMKLIINGEQVSSSVPLKIIDGTVMVPLRVVAESLNAEVNYDQASNSIVITGETPVSENQSDFPIKLKKAYWGELAESDNTWPVAIIIDSVDQEGKFVGKITWLHSNETNKIEGHLFDDRMYFTDTARIAKGNGALNCAYSLVYNRETSKLEGKYSQCGNGSMYINIK